MELKLELPDISKEQTLALAQFVKRVHWDEIRRCAVDDDEANRIVSAIGKLQEALEAEGYAPR